MSETQLTGRILAFGRLPFEFDPGSSARLHEP